MIAKRFVYPSDIPKLVLLLLVLVSPVSTSDHVTALLPKEMPIVLRNNKKNETKEARRNNLIVLLSLTGNDEAVTVFLFWWPSSFLLFFFPALAEKTKSKRCVKRLRGRTRSKGVF